MRRASLLTPCGAVRREIKNGEERGKAVREMRHPHYPMWRGGAECVCVCVCVRRRKVEVRGEKRDGIVWVMRHSQ